ncbi:unnamed protein product [Spirodela intermedia]|uniref:Uncharacterized protein n=1 Tax=Spirodela intermedia TaxID=51605 RepID=A0A7I8IW53_SPIIN|nr:unnamed protein product [Spirodela intermedia]CAA6662099.1 unnamed protein product [Spirodela intermedia]
MERPWSVALAMASVLANFLTSGVVLQALLAGNAVAGAAALGIEGAACQPELVKVGGGDVHDFVFSQLTSIQWYV